MKRSSSKPIVKRHITLPADLTAMVENELHDAAHQKRAYGTFSALIEELLRQWIGNLEHSRLQSTASPLKPLESLLVND